eukprot:jgi/Chrzof1/9597/Cz04g09050.t1
MKQNGGIPPLGSAYVRIDMADRHELTFRCTEVRQYVICETYEKVLTKPACSCKHSHEHMCKMLQYAPRCSRKYVLELTWLNLRAATG